MPVFVDLITNPKTKFRCLFLILTLMFLMIVFFGNADRNTLKNAGFKKISTERVIDRAQGRF
ncbi:MAG: hypothetical protein ACYC2T_10090 [Bacillota bacterium]